MSIVQFYCEIADTQLLTLVPTKRERGEDLNWVCREGLCKHAECVIPDILWPTCTPSCLAQKYSIDVNANALLYSCDDMWVETMQYRIIVTHAHSTLQLQVQLLTTHVLWAMASNIPSGTYSNVGNTSETCPSSTIPLPVPTKTRTTVVKQTSPAVARKQLH